MTTYADKMVRAITSYIRGEEKPTTLITLAADSRWKREEAKGLKIDIESIESKLIGNMAAIRKILAKKLDWPAHELVLQIYPDLICHESPVRQCVFNRGHHDGPLSHCCYCGRSAPCGE